MADKRARFRHTDVTRAIKAATACGLEIGRLEIEPAGRIIIYTGEVARAPQNDLDKWLEKKNARSA